MLSFFRLPVYGILKVYRKSDANELFISLKKAKNRTYLGYVYPRYIELRRFLDVFRYTCFYLLDWFIGHWHPSIAAYP